MTTSGWRCSTLVREAALNIANARSRGGITLLFAVLLGSAATAFHAYESDVFAQRLTALEAGGSTVVSLRASSPDGDVHITRASCEGLSRVPGVERVGLLVDEGTRDFPELGADIRLYAASSTLFPQLTRHDGLIGARLGAGHGVRRVTFAAADVRSLASAGSQPEGVPTNAAVVVPLPSSAREGPQCVVQLARFAAVHAMDTVLASHLDVRGGSVAPRHSLALISDPVAEWRERPGQFAALAAGAVGGLLSALVMWTRGNEIAAYRLSGTDRRSMASMLTVESFLAAGVFAFSGSVCSVALGSRLTSVPESLLWIVAGASVWTLLAAVGIVRSIVVSGATLTRER